MLEKELIKIVMAVTFLAGIGGYGSAPKVQEFSDTANSAAEVQRLSQHMKTAIENQVDLLSPSAFQEADKALRSAIRDQEQGKDRKDILHAVALGRAQLNRANQSAEIARNNMEEVVAARRTAIRAGASQFFADDFKKADAHLRDVTSKIEDNDLDDVAQNRGKLQTEYLDLELKAIQQANLGSVRAAIAEAVKEGAKDYAEQSLAIAEKKANDTEAFIVANRRQTDAIKWRSKNAMDAANHLLKITRASKAAKNLTSEEIALLLEKEQSKTQDERDQLATERKTAKDLAIETKGLKSDQAFNQGFEAARAKFTDKEAEVYRQGDRLVIRLRGLEFPVNQSVLRGSNFPLLAKVAKVVREFENPAVVVEGYTDSDGGKALNKRVSTERAQAVSSYLVSSGAVDQAEITAVGYGFERPLASNKTARGKAQNRRVDVVIKPHVMAD